MLHSLFFRLRIEAYSDLGSDVWILYVIFQSLKAFPLQASSVEAFAAQYSLF